MYKVIKFFTDLQDREHPYNVGDTFPREGMEITEDRLTELSANLNKQGEPLIVLVEERFVDDTAEETATGGQETDAWDDELDTEVPAKESENVMPKVKEKPAANKRAAKKE